MKRGCSTAGVRVGHTGPKVRCPEHTLGPTAPGFLTGHHRTRVDGPTTSSSPRRNCAITYAIEGENLQKTFKGKQQVRALDGVSLVVEQGTVFGLVGPNGSGKTTAVWVLTTILIPDRGTATVLGHNVVKEAAKVRSLIGLAGQYAPVDENLTGRENLVMVGRLNHLPSSYVDGRPKELFGESDLSDASDRSLKIYSGGMRRRLDLGAALVARPIVLFLDEPTSGLDPQSRNDLWEMIEGLVEEGTTVLLTTQYLEEADRPARTLSDIDHGRIIAEGSPDQLKASPGPTVLEAGLQDLDDAAATTAVLAAVGSHAPNANGRVIEVIVDHGPRSAMEALRSLDQPLDQQGIVPTAFAPREPSLDDVFLALTGRRAEEGDVGDFHQPDGALATAGEGEGEGLP